MPHAKTKIYCRTLTFTHEASEENIENPILSSRNPVIDEYSTATINNYVIREESNTSSGGKPCRPMTSTHFAERSRGSTRLKTVKCLLIIQLAAYSTLYKQVRSEICWTTKSNAGRQMCKFHERRGPCRPVTSFLLRQRSQATFLLFFQLSYVDEFP